MSMTSPDGDAPASVCHVTRATDVRSPALLTDASAQMLLLVSRQRDAGAFTLSRAAE